MRAALIGLLAASLSPALALAQAAPDAATATAAPGSPLASFAPLVLIFFVFYFLLIRPQQKRAKEHEAMLAELKKGDQVVTGGGVVGRVAEVSADDYLLVEIAKGVEVRVLRATVAQVLGKTPAAPTGKKTSSKAVKNDNALPSRERIANDN